MARIITGSIEKYGGDEIKSYVAAAFSDICDHQQGHSMAALICMIFIIFSEEESGLGRWPEPDDR
ncbi:MAG: hypothetical protein WAW52_13165 [Methanothrix sp.]